MGAIKTISLDRFPKQGSLLGRTVRVCFHYTPSQEIQGRCVRDDIEEPFETIFVLSDERVIRATECHYDPPGRPHEIW